MRSGFAASASRRSCLSSPRPARLTRARPPPGRRPARARSLRVAVLRAAGTSATHSTCGVWRRSTRSDMPGSTSSPTTATRPSMPASRRYSANLTIMCGSCITSLPKTRLGRSMSSLGHADVQLRLLSFPDQHGGERPRRAGRLGRRDPVPSRRSGSSSASRRRRPCRTCRRSAARRRDSRSPRLPWPPARATISLRIPRARSRVDARRRSRAVRAPRPRLSARSCRRRRRTAPTSRSISGSRRRSSVIWLPHWSRKCATASMNAAFWSTMVMCALRGISTSCDPDSASWDSRASRR